MLAGDTRVGRGIVTSGESCAFLHNVTPKCHEAE